MLGRVFRLDFNLATLLWVCYTVCEVHGLCHESSPKIDTVWMVDEVM